MFRQMEQKTLAELIEQNVEISFADAVAIAQQLICEPDALGGAEPPYGPLTPESVAITAEGAVRCLHTAATPTVIEVGLVLHTLLANSHRVPGRLRYTVGRAVHEVEAPPFESAHDFSTALERFEAADRREQIASLYDRARAASPSVAGGVSRFAPKPDVPSQLDRRRQRSATEFRRQLREADLLLYEAQRLSKPDRPESRTARYGRAPIAACMVAGVALVAVGELAQVGQRPLTPVPSHPLAPMAIATFSPIAAPSEPAVAAVPVDAAAAVQQPAIRGNAGKRTDAKARATTRSRTTREASSAANVAGSPARKADEPRPARERDKSGRGLLARIRFVWDNPFR
jgi:hypothetical protein